MASFESSESYDRVLFSAICESPPIDIFTSASIGDMACFLEFDTGKRTLAELSVSNQSGWTPLMYACSRGHALLVNYLLQIGVSRNCKSKTGVTPLMLSICSGDVATVKSIFEFSALEEKDNKNWTALFYAIHFRREGCVSFLLNQGANVNIMDYKNETPLMAAVKTGREQMVDLLVKRTKILNIVSHEKKTVHDLAKDSNNVNIQQLISCRHNYLGKYGARYSLPEKTTNYLTTTTPVTIFYSPSPIKKSKNSFFTFRRSKCNTYSPNLQESNPNSSFTVDASFSPKTKAVSPLSPTIRGTSSLSSQKFYLYNDVETFLKSIGLEKYWPIFRDEEVDFETLLTFTEENLKEVGIKTFGSRRKIFLAIQRILEARF